MRQKPNSCLGCVCSSHGTDFSDVTGTGSLGVMLVGEASGEMEAREGIPFVPYAPAGSVLERCIRRMGLSREQFWITNVLRCRPRNNWLENSPWEFYAISSCRANLAATLDSHRPRALVSLGGVATRELTGLAGTQLGVSHLAGYVLPGPAGADGQAIPVVPNFHPAFIRRGKASHQGYFSRVLRRAINVASGKDRQYILSTEDYIKGLTYVTRPRVEEAEAFARRVEESPQIPLIYDIETGESTTLDEDAREGFLDTYITLIQFSLGAGTAIALPWEGVYRTIAERILHTANVKAGHNVWLFDNKVLRACGEREGLDLVPRGPVHDTLQMFHHWQPDLPAHLQFAASFVNFPFPWKHLAASDIEFYGCCDVDATHRLYTMLEATLKRDKLWGDSNVGYLGMVYEVRPVLAAMEDRGVPIDDAARLGLAEEFDKAQGELYQQILAAVPAGLGRVHPKEGYKGIPPEIKPYLNDGQGGLYPHAALPQTFIEPGDDGERYHYEKREFPIANDQLELIPTLRWCRVYDFNPNSGPQVIAYMKAKGHPIPKSREEDDDGNRKDTTGEKELRRLAARTGDFFYLGVVEYRGFTKLRGTYIDGFKPGADGCVHPTFTFDTAIGQLSARNPNSQNFPKLKPTPQLAKSMRGMVAARPGYVLTEWDYKSFHVLTLGFLAEDPVWLRLARLDMHSFVAGHVLGLWDGPSILKESDAQLMERFKWLKSDPERKRVRDDQAKHGILGIGNGLAAKGLFERYMENFPPQRCGDCDSVGRVPGARPGTTKQCPTCKGTGRIPGLRVAETFHAALQKLAPKIFSYQRAERKAAHNAGDHGYYTPFAFARRFYEVYQFSKGWNPGLDVEPPRGDQAEQAVSYRHTNIAHCHLRAAMKELHRLGLDEKYGMFNQIHDALQFHFPEQLLEEHAAEIYPVLIAPSKLLRNSTMPGGLWVDAEGSVGRRWNEMSALETKKTEAVA